MKAKKAKPAPQPSKQKTTDLHVRYGEIGISAVAAAMRYQRAGKTKQESDAGERETKSIPEIAA